MTDKTLSNGDKIINYNEASAVKGECPPLWPQVYTTEYTTEYE